MDIRKIDLKAEGFNQEIIFINDTWETSNAWGHKSVLWIDGVEIATNKVRYYNRTWEAYQYQSCMCGIIYSLMDKISNEYIEHYKKINNIKRLSKNKREQAVEISHNDKKYKLYQAIYKDLRDHIQ